MAHIELLVIFQDIFHVNEEIAEWFPNGKNSIRIRFKESSLLPFMIGKGEDLIFTAESREEWKLETVGSWVNSLSATDFEKG